MLIGWAASPPKIFKYHHLAFYSRDFEDRISKGGFGEVYKGWIIKSKGETDKKVAIKASHSNIENEERRQREVSCKKSPLWVKKGGILWRI